MTPHGRAFTLFCLPGVGRTRAVYRTWSQYLPSSVSLVPLELPTFGYPEDRCVQDRVADMVARLQRRGALVDAREMAVFGHSFGALIGYELLRALSRAGRYRPRLFVAASPPPPVRRSPPPARESNMDDEGLVARLLALSNVSLPLLDADVRELLLPKIRADLLLEEGYRADPGPPLDSPVTAFGGTDDPLVGKEDLAGWARVTRRPVDCRMLPGGHLFVDDHAAEICRVIHGQMGFHGT